MFAFVGGELGSNRRGCGVPVGEVYGHFEVRKGGGFLVTGMYEEALQQFKVLSYVLLHSEGGGGSRRPHAVSAFAHHPHKTRARANINIAWQGHRQ